MESTPEQVIQQAEQLYKENKNNEIVTLLNDDLLTKYNNATLYVWRARAHEKLNEIDSQFTWAQKAIELDPSLAMGYWTRGNAWFEKEEYDKAIADYTDVIKLKLNNAETYYNRGLAWSEKKEYDKAITDYTDAIQLDSNDATTYDNRGNAWYHKKEYDKAIADYTDAIQLDSNDAVAYRNRGLAWSEKKEYDKAITDYTNAIQLDPNNAAAYRSRGLAWYYKKEYDKAIADYTDAIRLNPNFAGVYLVRGIAWSEKEVYDKAIADYTDAIRLDPNFTAAYYTRGFAWSEKKEYDKAIMDYNRYIVLANDSNTYNTQVALAKIGELKKRKENAWYDDIDSIVDKIKQLLLFDHPCLTHYTSLSGAREMILNKSPFRLSEGAFLNDTSEGRELFNYLSFETTKRTADETMAEVFVERPFIGSFVADTKHNDLTLWRMYGKEAQAEAKGCALTINRANFIDRLKKKISPTDTKAGIQSQSEEQFTFYNVAYLAKDSFVIPGRDDSVGSQLDDLMSDLKNKIKKLTKKQRASVTKLLNDIAYLFKSSEYQYENEVRLVVQGVGFSKTIDDKFTPPKVYIELVDIVPALTKITLGPKVERADEWAAAFNYHIKEQLRDRKEKVDIIISHLPFK